MLYKEQVITEAKDYIEKHGYANLKWFIKEKLNLKVQNSFINSVAALMVQDKKYFRDKMRIEKILITYL